MAICRSENPPIVKVTKEFGHIKAPCGCIKNDGPLETKTVYYDTRQNRQLNTFQVLISTINRTLVWINISPNSMCTWDEWIEYEALLKRCNCYPRLEYINE